MRRKQEIILGFGPVSQFRLSLFEVFCKEKEVSSEKLIFWKGRWTTFESILTVYETYEFWMRKIDFSTTFNEFIIPKADDTIEKFEDSKKIPPIILTTDRYSLIKATQQK